MISTYFKYEVWQLHNILSWIEICKGWKSLKGIGDSDHFLVYWKFKNKISICFIKDETEQGITSKVTWFFFFFLVLGDLYPSSISLHPTKIQIFWNMLLFYVLSFVTATCKGFSQGNLLVNSFLISTLIKKKSGEVLYADQKGSHFNCVDFWFWWSPSFFWALNFIWFS